MDTQNVQEEEAESDVVTFLRRGGISILEALSVKLPDVFAAEILPKLDITDTLSLAQVNKAYNAAVWSADGVRLAQVNKWYNSAVWSVDGVRFDFIEAKVEEAHLVNTNRSKFLMRWAAEHGNVPAVRACLESGVDVDKVLSSDNRTALHNAAMHGRAATAKALIEAGADVNKLASPNTVDESGKRTGVLHNVTPVCYAAERGHTHVVMELIKAGADLNQATSDGATPLYVAAHNGHEGIVAVLIQAGADVRKACKNGCTPLKIATDMKREKVVTLLKFYERV